MGKLVLYEVPADLKDSSRIVRVMARKGRGGRRLATIT
jgi:hypothetical protein